MPYGNMDTSGYKQSIDAAGQRGAMFSNQIMQGVDLGLKLGNMSAKRNSAGVETGKEPNIDIPMPKQIGLQDVMVENANDIALFQKLNQQADDLKMDASQRATFLKDNAKYATTSLGQALFGSAQDSKVNPVQESGMAGTETINVPNLTTGELLSGDAKFQKEMAKNSEKIMNVARNITYSAAKGDEQAMTQGISALKAIDPKSPLLSAIDGEIKKAKEAQSTIYKKTMTDLDELLEKGAGKRISKTTADTIYQTGDILKNWYRIDPEGVRAYMKEKEARKGGSSAGVTNWNTPNGVMTGTGENVQSRVGKDVKISPVNSSIIDQIIQGAMTKKMPEPR